MTETEELPYETKLRPSAFALSIVVGGTLGMTFSHMLGVPGDVGFLGGSILLFAVLSIAVYKDRNDKRDEIIEELENEILVLRRRIYESFIGPSTDNRVPNIADERPGQEIIREALRDIKRAKFVTGRLRPLKMRTEIQEVKSEIELFTYAIELLEENKIYETPLKAIKILKSEAEGEIDYFEGEGRVK